MVADEAAQSSNDAIRAKFVRFQVAIGHLILFRRLTPPIPAMPAKLDLLRPFLKPNFPAFEASDDFPKSVRISVILCDR